MAIFKLQPRDQDQYIEAINKTLFKLQQRVSQRYRLLSRDRRNKKACCMYQKLAKLKHDEINSTESEHIKVKFLGLKHEK